MKINPADPRLTSYALGELDEMQLADIEQLLEGSSVARRAVDEIRETAALLAQEFGQEPCPGLLDVHRLTIERRLRDSQRWESRISWVAAAVAASLLVAILFSWGVNDLSETQVAQDSTQRLGQKSRGLVRIRCRRTRWRCRFQMRLFAEQSSRWWIHLLQVQPQPRRLQR